MPGYSKPVDTIEKLKLQISSRINNNKKTDSFISSRAIPSPNLSPSNRPLIVGSAELCFPPLSPRRQLALTRSSAPPSSNRNSTSQRRQFHLTSQLHPTRTSNSIPLASVDRTTHLRPSLLPAEQHGYAPVHSTNVVPVRFCGVFSVARLPHLLNQMHPHRLIRPAGEHYFWIA